MPTKLPSGKWYCADCNSMLSTDTAGPSVCPKCGQSAPDETTPANSAKLSRLSGETRTPPGPGCSVAIGLLVFLASLVTILCILEKEPGDDLVLLASIVAAVLAVVASWRFHRIPEARRSRICNVVVRVFEGACYAVITAPVTFLLGAGLSCWIISGTIGEMAGESLMIGAAVVWGAVSLFVGAIAFRRAYRQSTGTIETGHDATENVFGELIAIIASASSVNFDEQMEKNRWAAQESAKEKAKLAQAGNLCVFCSDSSVSGVGLKVGKTKKYRCPGCADEYEVERTYEDMYHWSIVFGDGSRAQYCVENCDKCHAVRAFITASHGEQGGLGHCKICNYDQRYG